MSLSSPLLILGGHSHVAPHLMNKLAYHGRGAKVISRAMQENLPPGFASIPIDITEKPEWHAEEGSILMSLIPIWALVEGLDCFTEVRAVIALSTTSVFSKSQSPDPKERALAARIAESEQKLHDWGRKRNIAITILRPTLIYDAETDINIARMKRFIEKYMFLPLAAPALGKRQPIHAADVAGAIWCAINTPEAQGKTFVISGGETLTYRAMVERVFESMGRKPRLLMLPTGLLRGLFRLASMTGFIRENSFGFAIFDRMNQDLSFDASEAMQVLKYKPRRFMEKRL